MRRATILGLAFAVGIAGSAGAQVVVSSDITADTSWSTCSLGNPYILAQPIFVKNDATLTIPAGCVVRGQPRQQAQVPNVIAGTPGALIVTQTGRVVISGNPSNPVVMTTAAVDVNNNGVADDDDLNGFADEWVPADGLGNFLDDTPTTAPLAPLNKNGDGNVALWGGVVVLGNAPTNLADRFAVGYGEGIVEGLTVPGFPAADATYGGVDPHDNSGTIRYTSIRHAGDEIGNSNELNGLTLAGVGDGTTIEGIEVYANFDDGIEWFGGTVDGKRLAVFFVGDDIFDVDQGYTGINQFLFGIAPWFNENSSACVPQGDPPVSTPTQPFGSASGDKGGEFDGDDFNPDGSAFDGNLNVRLREDGNSSDPTPWPLSFSSFYNATLIGANVSLAQRGSNIASLEFPAPSPLCGPKRGFQARNGYAGYIYNSIVVNTSTEEGLEVDPDGGGEGAPGFGADTNANNGLILLVCSTFDDTGALDAVEQTVVTNGDAWSETLRGVSPTVTTDNNVINGAFTNLLNEDQTFNPTGNAAGKLVAALKAFPINPRPQGLTGVGGCVQPAGPGLDTSATYRGAFPAGASPLWTNGWTSLSQGGVLTP